MIAQGSMMFIIDIDTENGGMQMNNDFCVDFGDEPDGPALAHEVRLKLKYQMQNKQFPREKNTKKQYPREGVPYYKSIIQRIPKIFQY